eukprot:TRINITY_DN6010_c1_g1_i1.p1 TRINITY_DN6010_c1_g1~~TRINITY_DN6010_c1_g1_i1.p1  ORF type:complete len:569 (+),score=86.15 TRINITY_DN6010_c1_g1_i1:53-1708(+)
MKSLDAVDGSTKLLLGGLAGWLFGVIGFYTLIVVLAVYAGWLFDMTRKAAALKQANTAKCVKTGFKCAIIGSGMSGLASALKLQTMGVPFAIFEKGTDFGGTWYDNRYPGCQCDVPSYLYSISAYPCPKAGWKRHYSFQPDILKYIQELVGYFQLKPYIKVATKVTSVNWLPDEGKWEVTSSCGSETKTEKYNVVFSGAGPLHVPVYPNVPGKGTFKGLEMHTATWDPTTDLKGKRVAIVGSAASAIQAIPFIAQDASHLTVFQRTPNWVVPKPDFDYPQWFKTAVSMLPFLKYIIRFAIFVRNETTFAVVFSGGWLADRVKRQMTAHIEHACPKYTGKLIPPYAMGCKRILMSNEYYPALMRDNVDLITSAVEAVTETGLQGGGKSVDVDVIIWATGFDIRLQTFRPYECTAAEGNIEDELRTKPELYLGAMVPNFPNFFFLLGPNTGLGHNSVIIMTEAQLTFIEQVLQKIIDTQKHISVKKSLCQVYNDELQARLSDSVWVSGGCLSWYRNEAGRVDALWPGNCTEFIGVCRQTVNFAHFLFNGESEV